MKSFAIATIIILTAITVSILHTVMNQPEPEIINLCSECNVCERRVCGENDA